MIHSKDFKTRTFLKNSPPCWVGTIMILSLFGRDWWWLKVVIGSAWLKVVNHET